MDLYCIVHVVSCMFPKVARTFGNLILLPCIDG